MQKFATDATAQQAATSSEQLQSMIAQHESEMAVRSSDIWHQINLGCDLRR